MTISSVGATTLRTYPQFTNPASVAGPSFAQSLAVAAGPEAGTSASASSSAKADTDTPATNTKLDYKHMTPSQLFAASEQLLKAGKITIDEGWQMQWMARSNAWLQSQAAGSSNGSEAPVDFVQAFKDTRAFNASHGGWGAKGYDPYIGVLNAIGAGEQGGIA